MTDAILFFQDRRYFVSCFVVMPNHCHVVVKPLATYALEAILGSWKGYVGREVMKRLNRHGSLWQEESYDRIVRDEEHLYRIVQYIGRNPSKAGLPREQWVRWIHPRWQAAGWDFHEADAPKPTA
jgi:REP-associated tyrosine transposase